MSDAHYRESREAWRRAGLAGHLLGAGLLSFSVGAVRPRARRGTDAGEVARWRLAGASLIDGLLGLGLLALFLLDAGESAALLGLGRAAPWLSALPFAGLPAGTSPGLRALGLGVPPGPRGLVALLLWPLALLAPVGLIARPLAALHLRVAGLIPR